MLLALLGGGPGCDASASAPPVPRQIEWVMEVCSAERAKLCPGLNARGTVLCLLDRSRECGEMCRRALNELGSIGR